ncbi:MAG: winged helix-turn-helix domain-containing protein [Hydrogenophaga sp.]|nr:winged helix-turn-helix domain-containing protein [Hydrogenophaga sp.]
MEPDATSQRVVTFGPFALDIRRRALTEHGRPVRIGSRALDLLCVFVERHGEIISRDELVARVWPDTVVEETSLRVHVYALRKVLGDGHQGARYILNVPGRGYSFTAQLGTAAPVAEPPDVSLPQEPLPMHNLPPRLTRLIGRAETTAALTAALERQRLVTLVGAGGIGKTTVALDVAERRLSNYPDGVRFVDFSPLSEPALVPATLASAVGIVVPTNNPWPILLDYLRPKTMLLVLDNCEHVIDDAADLADTILKLCPATQIIATSREALNIDGEWVHRLAGLSTPQAHCDVPTKVSSALDYSAIELFAERAISNSDDFQLNATTLPFVIQICKHLDGIPLAIELAASRVDSLGVSGLASRLDDMYGLLTRGRRTAFPRHKTLQALLDWSYELLTGDEKLVLKRVSVFRAGFSIDAAVRIATCEAVQEQQVVEAVLSLTAKSLIFVDSSGQDDVIHRLLHVTRTYAGDKLNREGGGDQIRRLHAEYFRDLLVSAGRDALYVHRYVWKPVFSQALDDIRAALNWSLRDGADMELGIALTAAAHRPMYDSGQMDEYRDTLEIALNKLEQLHPPRPELEMRLHLALVFLIGSTLDGQRAKETVFQRAAELVSDVGDTDDRIEVLYGMGVGTFGTGDFIGSARYIEQIRPLAIGKNQDLSVILVDRFQALNQHHLGFHAEAMELTKRVLTFKFTGVNKRFLSEVPFSVSMRIIQARIHWMTGRPVLAKKVIDEAIVLTTSHHQLAICQVLGMGAIPISIWSGDLVAAQEKAEQLLEISNIHQLAYWQSYAVNYAKAISLLKGEAGVVDMSAQPLPTNPAELDMMGTLTRTFAVDATVARVEAGIVGWCGPEILRATGENILASRGSEGILAAQELFERALRMARAQGALAWELRAACSLARLRLQQGRPAEGRQALLRARSQFVEGMDSVDFLESSSLATRLDAVVGVRELAHD